MTDNFIHTSAKIGKKVNIGHFSVIEENVQIGNDVVIGHGVVIHADTKIESKVVILDNSVIGRPPRLGPNSTRVVASTKPTRIKSGVMIGTSSIIYRGVDIGKDTFVADMVHIRDGCKIGSNVTLAKVVSLEQGVTVGNGTKIMACSQIAEYTKIGKRVFIGADVSSCTDPAFARIKDADKYITIKDFAMIGTNATLGPGITIGKNALVSMGSVVARNVPDKSVVFGNPAKSAWKINSNLIVKN